jgi:hypothetical protein
VAFCGGSTYKVFICIGRSAFPRAYQKSQYNAVLSAHHSFAAPIPAGLFLGSINAGKTLKDRLTRGTVGIDLLPGRLLLV